MTTDKYVLLESADEIAIAGTIHYFVRRFGQELGEQVDLKLKTKASPNWFLALKQARKAAGLPTYDDVHDPRFLLKECLDDDGIVHFGINGFDSEWKLNAAVLRRKLNSWFHGSLEPNLTTFIPLVELLNNLAERSKLAVSINLNAALIRARSIEAGHYIPTLPQKSVPQNLQDSEFIEKLKAKKAAIVKRPPIGSEWTGAKGTRKIVISKVMNDVTENGNSIKNQLGPDPDEVIKSWLRYYPLGGEAKVADDGAVMGFKLGQAYLIGWLGESPATSSSNAFQGFVLPHEYIFTRNDVRDLTTGKLLSVDANEGTTGIIQELANKLDEGEIFSATPYGELVLSNDEGEPRLLTRVHKDIWFKGHLPG